LPEWLSSLKVDALYLNVFGLWNRETRETLTRAASLLKLREENARGVLHPTEREVRLGGDRFELIGRERYCAVIARCAAWRALFCLEDMAGQDDGSKTPALCVQLEGWFLAQVGWEVAWRCVELWVSKLMGAVFLVRVRRLDLAVDQTSSEPVREWQYQVVARARTEPDRGGNPAHQEVELAPAALHRLGVPASVAQVAGGVVAPLVGARVFEGPVDAAPPDVYTHGRYRRLGTLYVGARGGEGGYLRLYDKRAQIAVRPGAAYTLDAWAAEGFPFRCVSAVPGAPHQHSVACVALEGGRSVWRTEIELRSHRLRELGVRELRELTNDRMREIWAWATCKPEVRMERFGRGGQLVARESYRGFCRIVEPCADGDRARRRQCVPFWRRLWEAVPGAHRAIPMRLASQAKAAQLEAQLVGTAAAWVAASGANPEDAVALVQQRVRDITEKAQGRARYVLPEGAARVLKGRAN
jgi:hypothetical protein